jgi:hypothetical protein
VKRCELIEAGVVGRRSWNGGILGGRGEGTGGVLGGGGGGGGLL